MFRCKDCGSEYEIKPDFCDCGNDIFEEIVQEVKQPESIPVPKPKHKKTFEEQYPGLSSFFQSLDPISVIIFILCIILSICSIIFIKPKENVAEQVQKQEQKIERKVADINTFWNDTPPKPEVKQQVHEQTKTDNIVEQIINIIPKTEEPKKEEPKQTVNTKPKNPVQTQQVQPKTQPKTQTAIQKSQPNNKVQQTQKPVQKSSQTSVPKTNQTSTQNNTTKPVHNVNTQPSQPKQQTQPQSQQQIQQPQQQV
ncbi:hypothetical protein IJS77_02585, partial [bacterium]|nr:hypothetical protein [bacterium]